MIDTEPPCERCAYNDVCPYNGKRVPLEVCLNALKILLFFYPPEPLTSLTKKVYTIRSQTDKTNMTGNREYRRKLTKQKGR